MYFNQFYLGCLAHASYLIGSKGEAVVVDPQRDVEQYIVDAAAHDLKIVYVLETHLHADFVSGHRELAERTGATIVLGERARAGFPHLAVNDGDELLVGDILLRMIETPGHSPESICVLVDDTANLDGPVQLLTGDTLFIGDVGRPDLAAGRGYNAEEMAGALYDSLHNKVLQLDDGVEVYPAHGAGSLCGRSISKELSSTTGQQKQFNYALQPMSKQEFVTMMTNDLPETPAYFRKDAEMNRIGAKSISGTLRPFALSAVEVRDFAHAGGAVLDVRLASEFGAAHVPNAVNIGLSGQFATWAGSLFDLAAPIAIVADDLDQVDEAVMRLARVGIETVKGYLQGGMYAWHQAGFESANSAVMSVDELLQQIAEGGAPQIIDVRRPSEWDKGHIPWARNAELAHLLDLAASFDSTRSTAVICQSGYRASIAIGILAQKGFDRVFNVAGGMNAWDSSQPDSVLAMLDPSRNGLTI